jgi:CheY-like chemotaxis protein
VRENSVILVVEDRDDDVFLVLRSFERAGVSNPIQVVRNGEDAIAYIKGEGKFTNRAEFPLPELVLLDLKLPGIDGFEVLRWLRMEPGLSGLPVVVLTSSERIRDVNLAYSLGANSFLVKPTDFNQYVEMGSFIYDYWLGLSRTPALSRDGAKKPPCTEFGPGARQVFLRDRKTGMFYAGNRRWQCTQDALDFERVELAESVALAENLKNVDIVLLYQNPSCELTVPVVFPGVRRP